MGGEGVALHVGVEGWEVVDEEVFWGVHEVAPAGALQAR